MAQVNYRKNAASDREGQINFRYEKDKKDRLNAKAAEEGISVSQLLTNWCDEYIGEKPKSKIDSEARLAKIEQMTQAVLERLEKSEGKLVA
ncbi:MAG: hypothetical protein DSM106950_45070 [Stigonema ocellatum SAG 48.90 = DSM 106950]|nr:hypothetical protein [Stigonema ocellatum SAG 48.90 = DSM 106950]